MTGIFIVFEGGDGVGKSTQVQQLVQWFRERDVDVLQTRQPGGTTVGDGLRQLLLDPAMGDVSPRAEALMYAADKAQHVHEVVLPALRAGRVVVCDRYVDSMVAYQGAGRDLEEAEISRIAWWATGGLKPDLTVVLDVDPAQVMGHIRTKDRLESAGLEFHRRVRQHFLDLAQTAPERYCVVPARLPRDEIAAIIRERVIGLVSELAG